MKTFWTTEELYEATKGHQLIAQHVINHRAWIDGQWQDFKMSHELNQEFSREISELLGGWIHTKGNVYWEVLDRHPQHWGLARIFLEKRGENLGWHYCAGQDYTAELAQIRKYLAR